MPSGAQTPDGIIFLLALIFSKAPPRYPPHHGTHWAYTNQREKLGNKKAERCVRSAKRQKNGGGFLCEKQLILRLNKSLIINHSHRDTRIWLKNGVLTCEKMVTIYHKMMLRTRYLIFQSPAHLLYMTMVIVFKYRVLLQ